MLAPRIAKPRTSGKLSRRVGPSLSLEEQAGEVARLGNGEQHGMVRGLPERFDDAEGDARVGGRGAADLLEERGRDMVGARERHEASARWEQAHGPEVDL